MSIIFHIDVNSAFLSWSAVEELKEGKGRDLREIPSIVGGDQKSRRGVVLAKSIPAKKYGIRTGEPVANAFRKCGNLTSVPPNHKKYSEYSRQLMRFLLEVSPVLEQVSVDECYLDYSQAYDYREDYKAAAQKIKDEVKQKFGFTVNVGISSNKLLAKMASDFEKPDKVHTLFPEEIKEKMWPLPIGDLYMAGKKSVETLEKLEIRTIGELAKADPELVSIHLKSHGRKLWEFANGYGTQEVKIEREDAKNIGNSTTLSKDVVLQDEALEVINKLSVKVAGRLQKAGQRAYNIGVEIKYYDFTSASHQTQLRTGVSDGESIYQVAKELFQELWDKEPIRLLGVRSSKLEDINEPTQLTLFEVEEEVLQLKEKYEKERKIKEAMNEIHKKFGDDIIKKGI
ncbi:DNA polymerase-4 [Aequitasia blattaphilus]|uniref:DNA polymerase IV n=1 Tax=Aequitasia blattaphilus TaxID=2949332 RepID=A0ABT1EA85_9FIRM|nr:DNA polymerase IV [Aequitasia blattaphilus]MCP1102734.1 DNA polymerase IV [Aequitasia blattaphilus]MCR8615374.1 DNA polymerase IV [Aequitasia blattaphilus]